MAVIAVNENVLFVVEELNQMNETWHKNLKIELIFLEEWIYLRGRFSRKV